MINFEFFKDFRETDIEAITSVFKFFGRKSVWKILKQVYDNPHSTQQEIARKLCRKRISEEINFLVKEQLLNCEEVWLYNRMKRIKKYTINEENLRKVSDTYSISFLRKYRRDELPIIY